MSTTKRKLNNLKFSPEMVQWEEAPSAASHFIINPSSMLSSQKTGFFVQNGNTYSNCVDGFKYEAKERAQLIIITRPPLKSFKKDVAVHVKSDDEIVQDKLDAMALGCKHQSGHLYGLANTFCNTLDGVMMNLTAAFYEKGAPCESGDTDSFTLLYNINESFKLMCVVRNYMKDACQTIEAQKKVGEFSLVSKAITLCEEDLHDKQRKL